MTDLLLDDDGDLAVDANDIAVIDAADEVAQRLRNRLKLFRGEWFLDVTRGVPYREEVFAKRNSPARVGAAIKREILTTSGVLELLEYDQEIDASARSLTVTFKVRATSGEIVEISEALP